MASSKVRHVKFLNIEKKGPKSKLTSESKKVSI